MRFYVESRAVGFIEWPLTSSDVHLPFMAFMSPSRCGSPWSGSYSVSTSIWAFAHFTQFVQVGWSFLPSASGRLAGGGSFVTLSPPAAAEHTVDFATIIETVNCTGFATITHPCRASATTTQHVVITVPSAPGQRLAFWLSDTSSDTDHSAWFIRQADLVVSPGRTVTVTLPVNSLATITTQLALGVKGSHPSPPTPTPFPLPYKVSYTAPRADGIRLPPFFMDQRGVFELTQTPAGHGILQAIPESEVEWIPGPPRPVSIIGDQAWSNISVSTNGRILSQSAVGDTFISVGVRIPSAGIDCCGNHPDTGYYFSVNTSGHWTITRDFK